MAIIHIEKAFGHDLSIEDNFLYGDRILIAKVGKRDVTTLRESEGGWKVDGRSMLGRWGQWWEWGRGCTQPAG